MLAWNAYVNNQPFSCGISHMSASMVLQSPVVLKARGPPETLFIQEHLTGNTDLGLKQ